MKFSITTDWTGVPFDHAPFDVTLTPADNGVTLAVRGPFFGDPTPDTPAGQPTQNLWDFEVVEAFFLADEEKYLEVELCPHGQHLVLLLKGRRNMVQDMLQLNFTSEINQSDNTWSGTAHIPANYFPPKVKQFNAYAIHGTGQSRVYQSLYPADSNNHQEPDFHRLEYFREIDFKTILPSNYEEGAEWIFKE